MNVYDFYIAPEEYETAAKNGISSKTLEARIRKLAWTKDKAIHTPPQKKKDLRKWAKIAEQNGICYSTFRVRVSVYGWDLERAATEPIHIKKIAAKRRRRVYPKEYVELAEKNNIPYDTFVSRIRRGWDMEKAATHPQISSREIGLINKKRYPIVLFGS